MSGDRGSPRTGLAVSAAMHLALFAVLVFGFTRAPAFDDAPESIPVETITSTQLNEIMEGEKTAKPAPSPLKPTPAPLKAAAPKSTPVNPPPRPDPEPAKPEPAKPEPAKPEPPSTEPPPPEPPKRPEPLKPPPAPEPPKRPEPQKPVADDAPSPPTRPHPQKPEETPQPPERPRPPKTEPAKPAQTFKPDDIAKALARDKDSPRPKPAFDSAAISKLIGQTKTAEAAPAQGLANHHAQRMSVSLENALNEWFRDSYKNCWNLPPSNPAGENYVFDVRVTFKPDGSLAAPPVMLNPPHDPEWSAHADSVKRAVMRCNPLRVPSQYTPFFDQWRSKVIHFDPSSAEG